MARSLRAQFGLELGDYFRRLFSEFSLRHIVPSFCRDFRRFAINLYVRLVAGRYLSKTPGLLVRR
jgi:hypothetical protein